MMTICTVTGMTAMVHTDEHDHSAHDDHDHDHDAAWWVDLKSERYDFRTELAEPFAGFQKLRAHASYTDYKHDEIEGNDSSNDL